MRTFPLVALLVPLSVPLASGVSGTTGAPGEGIPDTAAPTYSVGEIVVTATRREIAAALAPSAVTVVSRAAIDAMPGMLLADDISWTPGLSLRSYGSGASVQTISMRGMSPEHTLVLIDGQRYNSFENGLADFGMLTPASVDHVELLRGGSSALYGADAVGGVINVITRSPGTGLHGGGSVTEGTAHEGGASLWMEGGSEDVGVRASISHDEGRGDYLFDFSDGNTVTTLRRSGEDYSVLTGDLRADWKPAGGVKAYADFSYDNADRGSPGVVTDPGSQGTARLWDRLEYLRTGISWNAAPGLALRLNAMGHYGFEHYDDPGQLLNGSTLHSIYTNRDYILTPEALFEVSPLLKGLAGVEYAQASLKSSDTYDALRVQQSAYLSTQHDVELPWSAPFDVLFYPSIRYDRYSDTGGDVSPMLGMNVGILRSPSLRLRASYGKSFRAPVLNDLYWIEGGNPALRPERALAFDCGLRADFDIGGPFRAEITWFSIRSTDRIVWLPVSGTFWSPRNIAAVRSEGWEAETEWTGLGGALHVALNATWTDVTKTSADYAGDPTQGKRLIYEPPETFNAVADAGAGPVRLFFRHSWTAYRYTTEVNDRFLPSYSLESFALRYALGENPPRAALKAEVGNLLNTTYQVVALYPMPLRSFRLTLEAGL
ncbi:MAG TPA: TonB-dependent receptor [Bacteroidota bacterium]|nr:TonB-dependent receptor [Bacteroidota bacterium]